jgi:isopentenyl-diphosphate Delta-isomerase
MEEMVDEVDEKDRVIATHPNSELKKSLFLHRASLIIPRTSDKKFLISRRAKGKEPFPDTWCCTVGGKARSGETSEDAAVREMKEEIGKEYPVQRVASFLYNKEDYKAIFTVFTTTVPVDPKELSLDPHEIQYTRALSLTEILDLVKKTPKDFAPTFVVAIREFAKAISQ